MYTIPFDFALRIILSITIRLLLLYIVTPPTFTRLLGQLELYPISFKCIIPLFFFIWLTERQLYISTCFWDIRHIPDANCCFSGFSSLFGYVCVSSLSLSLFYVFISSSFTISSLFTFLIFSVLLKEIEISNSIMFIENTSLMFPF